MVKTTYTKEEAGKILGAINEFTLFQWPAVYEGLPDYYKGRKSDLLLNIFVPNFTAWVRSCTENEARQEIGEAVANWAFDNDVSLEPVQSENLVKVLYRYLKKRGLDE